MKCSHCGAENPDNLIVCCRCGAPMQQGVKLQRSNTGRKKVTGIWKMILAVVLVLAVAGAALLLAREISEPETIQRPEQMQAEAEPQKETEVENAAVEAPSPVHGEAEQLLPATQEQSTSLPNLMGAWTQEETPFAKLVVYAQQGDTISFYFTLSPGEQMETVCAMVQELELKNGNGTFSYWDSHGNVGDGTLVFEHDVLRLEAVQTSEPNDELPKEYCGITGASGEYLRQASLEESGTFTALGDGEHLMTIYNGWFQELNGQLMALVSVEAPMAFTEESVFAMEDTLTLPLSQYGLDDRETFYFDYSEEYQAVWFWAGSHCMAYDAETDLWYYSDGGFTPFTYSAAFTWIPVEENAAVVDQNVLDTTPFEDLRMMFDSERTSGFQRRGYDMYLTVENGVVTSAISRYYE